jgi:hypothetical protein
MDGVALVDEVLGSQDLAVPSENVIAVLLEQLHKTQVEFLVALDGLGIVRNSGCKLTVLDVHSLHVIVRFFPLQLVIHDFLETHALEIQKHHETVVVPAETQDVVGIEAFVVNIEFVRNHV